MARLTIWAHLRPPLSHRSSPRSAGLIGAALGRLPEEQRQLLIGRFGEGRSVSQIARASRASRTAVSLDQLRALRALQQDLDARAALE